MSKIGIKLANHDFFPIIAESGKLPIEKELELTTVRDNQESVQINLFKKDEDFDPVYVASLIIEDLNKAPCGDATIFLKLILDENKNLSAQAIDKDTGNKQSLSISIGDLGQFSGVDFDFDAFDETGNVDSVDLSNVDSNGSDDFLFDEDVTAIETEGMSLDEDVSSFEEENTENYTYEENSTLNDFSTIEGAEAEGSEKKDAFLGDEVYEEKKSSFPTWLKIFLIILIFGLLALVVALFLKNKMREPKYAMETVEVIQQDFSAQSEEATIEEFSIDELTTEAPQREVEPFPVKEDSSVNEDNLSKEIDAPNEEIKNEEVKIVKDEAVKKAVRYRVRWGDTLWDISGNFYKNPWAYKRIARYNKIKNPNKIIAGTYITIPAK